MKRLMKNVVCFLLMFTLVLAMVIGNTFTAEAASTPGKVSGVTVTSTDYNTLSISWKKTSGAKKYEVYQATKKNGKYSRVKTVTSTKVSIGKLKFNTTYYYKVKAVNGKRSGKFSGIASAKTKLRTPSLSAKANGTTKISLSWGKVAGAEKYEIYRATAKNGKYTKLTSTKNLSYVNSGLKAGSSYYYKVRALRQKAYSSYSGIKGVTLTKHKHSYKGKITTAATCAKKGVKTFTCSCGAKYTKEIEKIPHEYAYETILIPADKKHKGLREITCVNCRRVNRWLYNEGDDKIFSGREPDQKTCKHSYQSLTLYDPTCTYTGREIHVCSVCGYSYESDIAKLGHHYGSYEVTKAATCVSDGAKTATCIDCGNTVTRTIPATGHNYDKGTVTKQPTCEAAGIKTFTCKTCNVSRTESIPALGHKAKIGTTKHHDASCEEDGYDEYVCANCSKTVKTNVKNALGHNYSDWKVQNEATCETDGLKIRTCSRCGNQQTEVIAKTGHAYDNGIVTKPATCETDGLKTYTCKNCGKTYTEVIQKTGHKYDNGKVTKQATCSAEGQKTYTCQKCGKTYTESIPKTEHQYDSGVITTQPTCTNEGIKTFTCQKCNDTYTESIPMSDHEYEPVIEQQWIVDTPASDRTYIKEKRPGWWCGKCCNADAGYKKWYFDDETYSSDDFGLVSGEYLENVCATDAIGYHWENCDGTRPGGMVRDSKPIYATRHIDEVGHYEDIVVGYKCKNCGQTQ